MDLGKYLAVIKKQSKLFAVIGVVIIVQLVANAAIIYNVSISQTKTLLGGISRTVEDDLSFKDNRWDTSRYDSDPAIPGNYRLYVITKDGFIIDRWRPIPGYLDTSDFKQLSTYNKPTTVRTITDHSWRLYTLALNNKNKASVGSVTVGRLIASDGSESVVSNQNIDAKLVKIANDLSTVVKINGSNISTEGINEQSVPFDVSFQIVDQYNKIHRKSDNSNSISRLPNYIDPSYIVGELSKSSLKKVKGDNSGETFLVRSTPLFGPESAPAGTVIVAKSITPEISAVKKFLAYGLAMGLLLFAVAVEAVLKSNKRKQKGGLDGKTADTLGASQIQSMKFSKKDCSIYVNGKQSVTVGYATNQYYLCLALFSSPNKKWETDELIEKFGDEHDHTSWRKLYDAMNSVNKKLSFTISPKLIISNNKTFQINPDLVIKIKQKEQGG